MIISHSHQRFLSSRHDSDFTDREKRLSEHNLLKLTHLLSSGSGIQILVHLILKIINSLKPYCLSKKHEKNDGLTPKEDITE